MNDMTRKIKAIEYVNDIEIEKAKQLILKEYINSNIIYFGGVTI